MLIKMQAKKLSLVVALASLTMLLVPLAFSTETCGVTISKRIVCDGPTTGLELFTYHQWLVRITVTNLNSYPVTNVRLADRFGAEFGVDILEYSGGTGGTAPELSTIGASAKVTLKWYIGSLGAGESATVLLHVYTDINPAGMQEFTSCGTYYMNSGAVVKWLDSDGHQHSAETEPIVLTTF